MPKELQWANFKQQATATLVLESVHQWIDGLRKLATTPLSANGFCNFLPPQASQGLLKQGDSPKVTYEKYKQLFSTPSSGTLEAYRSYFLTPEGTLKTIGTGAGQLERPTAYHALQDGYLALKTLFTDIQSAKQATPDQVNQAQALLHFMLHQQADSLLPLHQTAMGQPKFNELDLHSAIEHQPLWAKVMKATGKKALAAPTVAYQTPSFEAWLDRCVQNGYESHELNHALADTLTTHLRKPSKGKTAPTSFSSALENDVAALYAEAQLPQKIQARQLELLDLLQKQHSEALSFINQLIKESGRPTPVGYMLDRGDSKNRNELAKPTTLQNAYNALGELRQRASVVDPPL